MTSLVLARLFLAAALVGSPVAAPAANASVAVANVAENTVAATPAEPKSAPVAAPAQAQEKKICKQLPSSYSRMTKRTCLTEKEWKQVEQQSED